MTALREVALRGVVFTAEGHPNVRAMHDTTIEVTREAHLTARGDCIIGVNSEISPRDLPEWLKEEARRGATMLAVFCVDDICDSVVGKGSPSMSFSDETRMVFRRSDYVGPETVMIRASKASRHLRRDLIARLSEGARLRVLLAVLPQDHIYDSAD